MLENMKMGAKIRVSDYAYKLFDIYKDERFMDILTYSIKDIDDDVSEKEICESVEEATVKLNHLRDICIVRKDALLALNAYAAGLNVYGYERDRIIAKVTAEISSSYSVEEILNIRNNAMQELINTAHKSKEKGKKR